YAARAVYIIHAPAPKPRSIPALVLHQELYALLNHRMIPGPSKPPQTLHHSRGHVRGGRINHGVVVRERYIAQNLLVIIAVKRAPPAVAVLHAQQPLNPPPHRRFHSFSSGYFTRCSAINTN